MSREVRRVPLDWQHPKSTDVPWSRNGVPEYVPLHGNRSTYEEARRDWEDEPDADWPKPELEKHWMPDFSDVPEEHLGWCMYEATSEGTPISPVCKTPEDLAHWLANTGANAWAGQGASYESWLETIRRGSSVGAVYTPETGMISGVSATTTLDKKDTP